MKWVRVLGLVVLGLGGCGDELAALPGFGQLVECEHVSEIGTQTDLEGDGFYLRDEVGEVAIPPGESWCLTSCTWWHTFDGIGVTYPEPCTVRYLRNPSADQEDHATFVCGRLYRGDNGKLEDLRVDNYFQPCGSEQSP